MTKEDIRTAFIEELLDIAPDIDPDTLGEDDHLQDDLELDSMDVLNLVTALHRRLNVDIPETDYPQIATLALAVSYLTARVT
ncbi:MULTISPECIES: acyl carrier protein [Roseobacteraceae]|uniref:Phosphopantetheine-binding protein n=1 Tax=Celeribacter baekdonensis B30 TaxID=1208323 RepID=K2JJK9_9RHOB|nr:MULTISPECIES: acyl carrier protein [Roseobacteraceae]EKE74612.1 phosphopantetheine-binding protein [Celeribacter baekdonensis B30]KAB6714648.1 acyl carrier protein [Roseobacter sp. TSBP12]|tara:strand:- start:6793 stop:7038 length:246 start_codon:yes stop_codon:yes gene_type:complete